ncbi:phosphatase PAP2 family protein [Methanobrevibacter olleyae]|uniref:PAP2 superfamily protein n=1 Tax=Methanobrevibacter olleyae TaxID=294671 RepID=A0A126R0J5_METOL|nr:phosphatase PAP2 family protein [Methanobrevibacter olleyae]AMK15584.1 PAP2 superfamily protein [Methanobrevibacter olleyae]
MNKKSIVIYTFTLSFIVLIILIKIDLTTSFDSSIYNLVTMNMNDNLTNIYKSITFLGSGVFITISCLLSLVLSFILKKRNIGLIITSCVTINSLFSEFLKIIIARPRPEILQITVENSYSFPSSHTVASVSLCGILLYLVLKREINKKIKLFLSIILVLLPILIGISRIYLGVHNLSDVLGGGILAITLLLIEIKIIEKKIYTNLLIK